MSQQTPHQEERRPPKLVAGTVTALVGVTAFACYLPQLGLIHWHTQQKLDGLCARAQGCLAVSHRVERAQDRTALVSVVNIATAQRWRAVDVERFKGEVHRALPGRTLALRITAADGRVAPGSGR